MSDIRGTRDFEEEGFHEIQLSGKQLVFLCMATTVVSIVIFLCGVLVGRGVRPVETIAEAATPPAAADTPVAEPAPPPPVALPAPARTTDAKPAASATPTPATPPASAPAPAPKAPASRASSDEAKSASGQVDAAKAAAALAPPKPPATEPTRPATPKADTKSTVAAAPPTAPATTAGGGIAVQVGALRSRADAEALARRLSDKGYATYIVAPLAGAANQVFKVRVGNYASQDEAERVKRRLQQEEKLQPWITH
jgi:cell division septation protein DedD